MRTCKGKFERGMLEEKERERVVSDFKPILLYIRACLVSFCLSVHGLDIRNAELLKQVRKVSAGSMSEKGRLKFGTCFFAEREELMSVMFALFTLLPLF